MTSSVGLELGLTWKTVSRGNRSGTRRTRKSIAKKSIGGVQPSDGNSRPAEDCTVSESEKLGVVVLGQRFNEKVEHIPIKKRRFLFPSPSPPPSPRSSLVDIPEQHKVIQCTSGQTSYSNSTQEQKITDNNILAKPTAIASDGTLLEVKNENCMEDFSGIEMLAAAACNDGVDDYADSNEEKTSQEDLKQERNDASLASLILSVEAIALLDTELSNPKDSGTTVPLKTDISLLNISGSEVKIEESCLLPSKDSGNEVRMEDSSLVTQKDSGKIVKMEDPSLLLPEDAEKEVKTEDLSVPGNAIAVFHESTAPSYRKSGEMFISVPDDRSLWDLNLSIDAWEKPCESGSDDYKNNVLGNINVEKDAVLQDKDFHNLKKDSMDEAFSSDVGRDKCLPCNLGPLPSGTEGLNENKLEGKGTSSLIGKDNKHVPLRADNTADFVLCIADNADASARLVGIDQFSSPPCSGEENITSLVVVKQETVEIAPSSNNVELGKRHCASVAEAGKYICNKNFKLEQSDVASSCAPVLEMVVKDVECKVRYNGGKPHGGDSVFQDDKMSGKGLEICETQGKAMPKTEPASGMEDKGICHSSSRCGDMLALGSSVIVDDVMGQSGGAPSSVDYEIDTSAVLGSEKTSESFAATPGTSGFNLAHHSCRNDKNGHPSTSEKAIVSDSCNQSPISAANTAACGFTVAHEAGSNDANDPYSQSHADPSSQDKEFTGGRQSCLDPRTGYDSQFEDGELRESDAPWDEIEQVDYDTEGEVERLCGLDAENSEEKLKIERGLSPGSDDIIEESKRCDMQDDLRDNSVSLKVTTGTVVEGSGTDKCAISFVDGVFVKDPHSALDGPRTIKRELVEASQSFDALEISRSNYCDVVNRQAEKDAGTEELPARSRSLYIHGRRAGGDPYISHSASQNIFYGPNSSLHSRPKSVAESRFETADVSRTENDMGNQFMSFHSNVMYRPFVRRQSPAERDDSYGMCKRMTTVRDTSPGRTRFRRYPQGVHRGVREEQRYIPDDTSGFIRRVPSSDGEQRSRSGNFVDSYAQSEREGGSDKFIGRDRPATRMRGRSARGGQYYNHSVSIRNEYIKHAMDDGAEYISHLPSSNALRRNRSDDFDVSYPQAERGDFDKFIGRERPTSSVRDRSPCGEQIFNPSSGYWDSKRQHSPSHQGAYHAACPRPKIAIEGRRYVEGQTLPEAASMTRRPDNRINRPFMSSPSSEGYRPYMRRRSPVERDDSYGMHTRMTTVRDGNPPDRNRFRRYPQGVGRGVRNDYLRHDPDEATESLNRMPRRIARRERSISPESCYAEPFKKTRSRSRSRSPMGFLVQRDRNDGPRRQSRPDFRPDARVDRVRLFPKRFPAEYGEGFISLPRGRMSPQQNSRVFEDGNSGLDHMRSRKSPVRMFRKT